MYTFPVIGDAPLGASSTPSRPYVADRLLAARPRRPLWRRCAARPDMRLVLDEDGVWCSGASRPRGRGDRPGGGRAAHGAGRGAGAPCRRFGWYAATAPAGRADATPAASRARGRALAAARARRPGRARGGAPCRPPRGRRRRDRALGGAARGRAPAGWRWPGRCGPAADPRVAPDGATCPAGRDRLAAPRSTSSPPRW